MTRINYTALSNALSRDRFCAYVNFARNLHVLQDFYRMYKEHFVLLKLPKRLAS